MTIIVFLLDNSASMAQKSYIGVSYLDSARQFVEAFLKLRQRGDVNSKNDRYMLMGFDEWPRNVKAGWKENQIQFNEQLRNLRPTGQSQFSEALFNAIRFVNLSRVYTGMENYGYGRFPSYSEQVIFIAIVDGTSNCGRKNFLHSNNKFPKLPAAGAELTEEPFRWDHKLFVVNVCLPSHPPQRISQPPIQTNERKQIEAIVEKMNGKSFELNSHKITVSIIEQILQRMQPHSVFVKFDRFGPPPSNIQSASNGGDTVAPPIDNWKSQVVQITRIFNKGPLANSQSTWPIPESFWPDPSLTTLPPRKVFPELVFRCDSTEHVSVTNIPLDRYELEPCPLTQILIDKKNPNECWQVFVNNSSKTPGIGYPFGYLKLSANLQTVNLFVFPYNYPLLFVIIEESRDTALRSSPQFKHKVDRYFSNLPLYYISALRKALGKIPIPHQYLNDQIPVMLYGHPLISQFKKWKEQGREEYETTCAQVSNFINPAHQDATRVFNVIAGIHQLPMVEVTKHLQTNLIKAGKIGLLHHYQPAQALFKDCKIAVSTTRYLKNPSSKFRNPYDIEREEIIEHLEKMRVNLDQQIMNSSIAALEGGLPGQRLKLQHAEDLHTLPVTKMGDYQEYSKRLIDIGLGPMREFEQQVAKPHAFGNPFKLDKKSMAIDEVGEVADTSVNNNSGSQSPLQNGINKNAAKLREWKRRFSQSSSRESTPEPDAPESKRPRLDTPPVTPLSDTTTDDESEISIIEETQPSPTSTNVTPPVANNLDITKPQVQQKANHQKSANDPRLTSDKTIKRNGNAKTKNGKNDIITIEDNDQPQANSSDIEVIKTVEKPKKQMVNATPKAKKRPQSVASPINSKASPSSSSGDEIKLQQQSLNQISTVFNDDGQPINVEFKRRPYPQNALTSAEDPPVLSKHEMIRKKFNLSKAIRHKNNSTRFDPSKECIRLINELSWREQFDCLEYAHEQAKKFGLNPVAIQLNAELKRVSKCIKIVSFSTGAHKTNGTSVL